MEAPAGASSQPAPVEAFVGERDAAVLAASAPPTVSSLSARVGVAVEVAL
jgi:hypothetical protein